MMTPANVVRTCSAAAAVMLFAACRAEPPEHGILMDPPRPAPALHLSYADGREFDLVAQHLQLTFVYFGYTHCPDACPATLTDWARARAMLGASARKVHFVFVSVDPERDAPEAVQRYARQFDSTFVGLVATPAQVESITRAWGFAVEREQMPGMKMGEYGVSHPAGVYFVDGEDQLRFIFSPGTKSADVASDLKRLM